MLFDENSVYQGAAGLERVFPPGFLDEPFVAASPTPEDLRAMLKDPAFLQDGIALIDAENIGMGMIPLKNAAQLIGLRARDWVKAAQGRLWAVATKIGVFDAEAAAAVPQLANAVMASVLDMRQMAPTKLSEEIAKGQAFAFAQLLSSFSAWSNATALQYIGTALQIYGIAEAVFAGQPALRERLPLPDAQAAALNDENRVRLQIDTMRSSKNWTELALPAYQGDLHIWEAGQWTPEDTEHRWSFIGGLGSANGPVAGGGFGFMPGTARTQDLLEFPGRWTNGRERNDLASWHSYKCRYVDEGCFVSPKNFVGDRDCRQCVTLTSMIGRGADYLDSRPGVWQEATKLVRTGDWYSNSTESIAALWSTMSWRNAAIACFDLEAIDSAWADYWGAFFEGMPALWTRHDSYAWRAVVSQIAACGLISREDGRIGGAGTLMDWRVSAWSNTGQGVEASLGQPLTPVPVLYSDLKSGALAARTIERTPFAWDYSVYATAIRPAIIDAGRQALALYRSSAVAYLHGDQPLHATSSGKLRNNIFGDAYREGITALLDGPAKFSVDMRNVVDPNIYQALIARGVNPKQMGLGVKAPEGINGQVVIDMAQLRESLGLPPDGELVDLGGEPFNPPEPSAPPRGGYPGDPLEQVKFTVGTVSRPRRMLGTVLGFGGLALLGGLALRKGGRR